MIIGERVLNSLDNWTEPLLGVELEVEGCRPRCQLYPYCEASRLGVDVDGDGSLRNDGAELITMPALLSAHEAGMGVLYEGLNKLGVHFSARCGTHVHRNVLPLTFEQLGAVLCAYCLVEPLFMEVCGRDREENIYCVPLYRTPSITRGLDTSDEETFSSRVATLSGSQWCKYSALNMFSVRRLGTIEFRMAPAWETPEKMLRWIRLVDSFVTKAAEFPSAAAVWEAASTDLFGFLERVWPEFSAPLFDEYEWAMNDVDSWAPALNLVRTRLVRGRHEWRFRSLASPIDESSGGGRSVGPRVARSRPPDPLPEFDDEPEIEEEDDTEFQRFVRSYAPDMAVTASPQYRRMVELTLTNLTELDEGDSA